MALSRVVDSEHSNSPTTEVAGGRDLTSVAAASSDARRRQEDLLQTASVG
jgi:hypothetical protein